MFNLAKEQREQKKARKLDLFTWTEAYRKQLIPGRELNFKDHAYLRGLYTCRDKSVVVQKSAQMGVSEYLLSYAIHSCDQRLATVLYVFPTEGHVSDFSSARLGPAIEASEYLAGILISGADGAKRGADRVTLKRIGDRFMYFRGARVDDRGMAPQLKSIDADVLILDEVDEMDPRAPAIARKRLGHSMIAEERMVSTPTYPGIGINAEWKECDQRHWYVPCPHCGEKQPLSIHGLITEWDSLNRPVSWHQKDGRAFIACIKCGKALDRFCDGEWVPHNPTSDRAGFQINKLVSANIALEDLIRALTTTDETKMREAWNQDLGEPYTPRGLQINDEVLDACTRDYIHGEMDPLGNAVAGIDVGRVLHCVIRGFDAASQERKQLFAGEIQWSDVDAILKRFNVKTTVIDAMPETTKARELQAKMKPGSVWLNYYSEDQKSPEPISFDDKKWICLTDRTRSLDATFALFFDKLNTLPANIRGAGSLRDYYPHLKASVRTLQTNGKGEQISRYVETGPDHFAHAENYCAIARFVNQKYAEDPGWISYAKQLLSQKHEDKT